MAIHSPKSLKRRGKAPPDELRMRLWPCSPEQAAAFQLPAHIIGPRRRRGPAIVGVDDKELDEDAWKCLRFENSFFFSFLYFSFGDPNLEQFFCLRPVLTNRDHIPKWKKSQMRRETTTFAIPSVRTANS